jgi:hypothetical protein
MQKLIDRLLLGGAFVYSGVIHRRVDGVDQRVDDVEQSVTEIAERPPIPAMPLPTGYGLQVAGPAGEDILVPVCLPPGFELASMVLRPSFLPSEHRAAAPAPHRAATNQPASPADTPPPVKATPQAAPAVPGAPARDSAPAVPLGVSQPLRDAVNIVYSEEPAFYRQFSGEPGGPEPRGPQTPRDARELRELRDADRSIL